MGEILRKIKIYLTDAYYVIFRYPAYTEIRLQKFEKEGTEAENTRLDQHYQSYTALKRRHKKIKYFFISLVPVVLVIILLVFVAITFILNMLFSMLGAKNNPFHLHTIFTSLINYFK